MNKAFYEYLQDSGNLNKELSVSIEYSLEVLKFLSECKSYDNDFCIWRHLIAAPLPKDVPKDVPKVILPTIIDRLSNSPALPNLKEYQSSSKDTFYYQKVESSGAKTRYELIEPTYLKIDKECAEYIAKHFPIRNHIESEKIYYKYIKEFLTRYKLFSKNIKKLY